MSFTPYNYRYSLKEVAIRSSSRRVIDYSIPHRTSVLLGEVAVTVDLGKLPFRTCGTSSQFLRLASIDFNPQAEYGQNRFDWLGTCAAVVAGRSLMNRAAPMMSTAQICEL
jgi:hypothetical protein